MKPAAGNRLASCGCGALAVIALVLLVGVVAVQFLPVHRLHGWSLYVAGALLLISAVLDLVISVAAIPSALANALDWVARVTRGRGRRGR